MKEYMEDFLKEIKLKIGPEETKLAEEALKKNVLELGDWRKKELLKFENTLFN
jgi:hypothetical protein